MAPSIILASYYNVHIAVKNSNKIPLGALHTTIKNGSVKCIVKQSGYEEERDIQKRIFAMYDKNMAIPLYQNFPGWKIWSHEKSRLMA